MVTCTCVWVVEVVRAFGSSHLIASVFSINENYQSSVESEDVGGGFGCMRRKEKV